jgi:hypothetical protein
VFTFVALWHDLSFKLLAWGWMVTLFILPEVLARQAIPAEKVCQTGLGHLHLGGTDDLVVREEGVVSAFGGCRRRRQSPHDDDCKLGRIRARLGWDETPVDGIDDDRRWVEVHGVCVWMLVCGDTGHV